MHKTLIGLAGLYEVDFYIISYADHRSKAWYSTARLFLWPNTP